MTASPPVLITVVTGLARIGAAFWDLLVGGPVMAWLGWRSPSRA